MLRVWQGCRVPPVVSAEQRGSLSRRSIRKVSSAGRNCRTQESYRADCAYKIQGLCCSRQRVDANRHSEEAPQFSAQNMHLRLQDQSKAFDIEPSNGNNRSPWEAAMRKLGKAIHGS